MAYASDDSIAPIRYQYQYQGVLANPFDTNTNIQTNTNTAIPLFRYQYQYSTWAKPFDANTKILVVGIPEKMIKTNIFFKKNEKIQKNRKCL